ncbi:hypothetical protein FSP39_019998 [Pinctada imbricata]|uniref:PIN domain-containing protein n=1 Tax=Pinctada imbricata TaxID=66713 RepID=A0AA88XP47_PINIB|nr:hypothetical protein FSP39_019998 [Pinctada imbricata]
MSVTTEQADDDVALLLINLIHRHDRTRGRGGRQKRPTQGIYRPPIRGRRDQGEQDSGENWEDELDDTPSTDSKENSVDREVDNVQNSVKQLSIDKTDRDSDKAVKDAAKLRSKRPEIQRYVPKPKLEQQQRDTEDENDDGNASHPDKSLDTSPRKVDLKENQKGFQITVVNEGSPTKGEGQKDEVKGQGHEKDIAKSTVPPDPISPLLRLDTEREERSKGDNVAPWRGGQQGQLGQRRGQFDDRDRQDKNDRQRKGEREGFRDDRQRKGEREGFRDDRQRKGEREGFRDDRQRKGEREGFRNRGRDDYDKGRNQPRSQRNQEYSKNRKPPQQTLSEEDPKSTPRENLNEEGPKPQRAPRDRRDRRQEAERNNPQDDRKETEEDTEVIKTMVFERRSTDAASSSGEVGEEENISKKPPKSGGNDWRQGGGGGGGKQGSKRYSLSAMRRPRTGSISSDVSNTSDISIDEETTTRILDWDKEVEREMAKQVHDESLKISEFLQNKGEFNDWDAAIRGVEKAREDLERNQKHGKDFHQRQQKNGQHESDRDFGYWDEGGPRGKRRQGSNVDGDYNHTRNRNRNAGQKDKPADEGFRQRRNSDGSRSRRDQRRKGSLNGRRSRDSSVSSVNSTRSYQSEGYDSWPRRRNRRRKNSNGSLRESSSREMLNDTGNMNLKVTFARDDKRQVMVHDHEREGQRGGRGRGRGATRGRGQKFQEEHRKPGPEHPHRMEGRGQRGRDGDSHRNYRDSHRNVQDSHRNMQDTHRNYQDSHRNFHDSHRNAHNSQRNFHDSHRNFDDGRRQSSTPELSSSPRGGGLIKLPTNKQENQSSGWNESSSENRAPPREPHAHIDRNLGANLREAHSPGAQRMLFDPKNPNKPILIPGPKVAQHDQSGKDGNTLHFKETDGTSPQATPPPHPFPPAFPPMAFRPPGYPMYPGYDPRFSPESPFGPMPPMPPFFYGYSPQQYREIAMQMNEAYSRECQGEDPEQLHAGRTKAQCRVMAEHLFQDALAQDNQLSGLVSRRMSSEGLKMMAKLRYDLQNKYEQIMLLDLDVTNRHNVEQLLWKSVYYQVIEMFRKAMSEDHDDKTKTELSKVLDEGTAFFDKLLQKLQQTYNLELEAHLDTNSLPPENLSRSAKLALLSAQRTMINLGDIARYREQMNDTGKVNYGRARHWYTKAQQLAPKNGRPYNQLAILALYTRRKLDAVYFYMRSLAATNPFLTARESLMSLFDEARKKAESAEKKREEEKDKLQQYRKRRPAHGQRIEVWVAPDGTSSEDQIQDGEMEDLSKLDAVELNKRFNLSFLNVHGKLFTKIGRENFPECCAQMLREFQALLRHGALGPTRLIQLVAINIFAIENTALKDESLAEDFRSELQEHAVQLGMDMFGILVERCGEQLEEHLKSSDYPSHMFSRDLEELVPGVKKWTDWMICNARLYNPPPSLRDTSLGPNIDVMKVTAKFLNILQEVDISHVKLYQDKREGCDPILLFEDNMLSGFVPLMEMPMNISYVHSTVEKDIARDCQRIDTLNLFGEYLCGIEPPMLAFNVNNKQYYSVTPSPNYAEDQQSDLPSDTDEEEDVVIESEEEVEEGVEPGEDDEHVRQLRLKKAELRKKKEQHQKEKENIEKLLEKNRHRCIELEIRPIFLIPDTNCFIEHFTSMQKLITLKKFTVVVPLIVINELDGLAKGSREGHYDSQEHANKVRERSKQTVQLLEAEFEKKNSHLKAQTSKGSTLETIAFRSEESDMKEGNNDDLILSCCLHFCKDKAREFMPKDKDAPVRLYRDVVLLTDDRNLRLKAHTHNVPVKDVTSFLRWSKIT